MNPLIGSTAHRAADTRSLRSGALAGALPIAAALVLAFSAAATQAGAQAVRGRVAANAVRTTMPAVVAVRHVDAPTVRGERPARGVGELRTFDVVMSLVVSANVRYRVAVSPARGARAVRTWIRDAEGSYVRAEAGVIAADAVEPGIARRIEVHYRVEAPSAAAARADLLSVRCERVDGVLTLASAGE